MRHHRWLTILLVLAWTGTAAAQDAPRRTTRVESQPARTSRPTPRASAPQRAPLAPKPSLPSTAAVKRTLLEPSTPADGGRSMVIAFEVRTPPGVFWQLVLQEIDGPVAQIFEGQGEPPARIPWDGRLLDGGLAWSGMDYTYYVAFADSTGEVGETSGGPFTLPAYTHEDRGGISFLLPGDRLATDTATAATLRSVANRLDRDTRPTPVRVEVLAESRDAALTLGESVRSTLLNLLATDRAVDLFVGEASAAPRAGTVLITTAPLTSPSS
jgi:hypothetical protein